MTALAAGLLAPDGILPGRDQVLDADALGHFLSARLGAGGDRVPIERCELVRAHYRFGRSLRVLHRIRVRDQWRWISGRVFKDARAEKAFRRAGSPTTVRGGLHEVVYDADQGAVFWTFPSDRSLVDLVALLAETRALARRLSGPQATARIIGYRPEHSLVLRIVDSSGQAVSYVKIYRNGGREAALRHDVLTRQVPATDPHLRVPAAIARAADGRIVVFEAIDGRRLGELDETAIEAGIARHGAALATFHTLAPPPGVPRFARVDPDQLAKSAAMLARACPNGAPEAAALAEELGRCDPPSPDAPVCLHGDVHLHNGILTGDRVALIDFDKLALGPPVVDLGSFLSLLHYQTAVGILSVSAAARREAAILRGYGSVRPLPEASVLRWHTAAALLAEQAVRAVRRVRPEALGQLPRLLAEARRVLKGNGNA